MKIFRYALLLAALSPMGSARAQYCFVVDWAWQAGHQQAQNSLQLSVDVMAQNLTEARALTLSSLLSATKVVTKQASINSDRATTTETASQKALASTITQQQRNDALTKAVETYSPETGQGVQSCASIGLLSKTVESVDNTTEIGKRLYTDLDNGPGKATKLPDAVKSRLTNAQKTDASVFLDPSASDADRQALIQELGGMPMALPTPNTPGSEADLMMLQARRVEALRSPALVSLSIIRAMSNAQSHEVGASDVSPLAQLDELTGQYGGGPKFEQWSAALAGQSEHGLLIELARLRSINMKLRQTLSDQNARIGALFATQLAASTGDL